MALSEMEGAILSFLSLFLVDHWHMVIGERFVFFIDDKKVSVMVNKVTNVMV